MMGKVKQNKILSNIFLSAISIVAGVANGFLGTGGGIIFVWGLTFFTENDEKDNFATTLCAILPICIVGSFAYIRNSNVDFAMLTRLIFPAIIGGVIGAFLTDKIDKRILSVAFSALIIYSGVSFILR